MNMKEESSGRPNSDALLKKIKAAETKQNRGRLKVFFGMCAGVGKTFAMLREARLRQAEGRDIVIGLLESHGRTDTEALAAGVERVPLLSITYREKSFSEFKLEAALQRRPWTILVDEMAHSNVPGARHPKRYQDILELLDHGIDVFTTLNIQHLESYATTIEEITGVRVRETVPDSLLELADEIALIDVSESELLKRLSEGKVYVPEGARRAAKGFFRPSNLIALREMALRFTAEHVDQQLRSWMESENIPGPWKSSHRLMVGLSWSPFSAQLIRWAKRMVVTLGCTWVAAYIETSARLTPAQTKLLMQNMRLAQELGAEIITVYNEDVAAGLMQVARQKNVAQIVVGKPAAGRVRRFFTGETLVDKLIRSSGQIDIHVVRGERAPQQVEVAARRTRPHPPGSALEYGLSLLTVAVTTAILFALSMQINYLAVAMFLLFVVTLLSLKFSQGPVLAAAALSALLWDYLFIPPHYTFSIGRIEDVLILCLYFLIAIVTGTLTTEIRRKEEIVRQREKRARDLYNMSQQLASADSLIAILGIADEQISRTFNTDVAIFLLLNGALTLQTGDQCWTKPKGDEGKKPPAQDKKENGRGSSWIPDEKESSVAKWVAQNRKPAGRFTPNLPQAHGHYEPLATSRGVYGVIGIQLSQETVFTVDEESLLANFCSQIAAAIERERFNEHRHQVELAETSEKLYKTLLNAVSHEFRTPLSVISGAIETLTDAALSLPEPSRHELLQEIQRAASRLHRLVENLLDMSRLDSGRIYPKLEWCEIGDVFSALCRRFEPDIPSHPIEFNIIDHMPLIFIDPGLLEQALAHIIQNAIRYTPAESNIEISARLADAQLHLTLLDHGVGIPEDALPHLFEKFFRVAGTSSGGTGLGLSICKGMIESMHGTITAANAPGSGLCVTIRMPIETMTPILKAPPDELDQNTGH